jgi:radical SAM protein with 4Fe4S-binding SPASM domain
MGKRMFHKIIDELAAHNYSGIISYHVYGEPLLHESLVDFVAYSKKVVNSRLILYTNGTLLTEELIQKLIDAGIDIFDISEHGTGYNKAVMDYINKNPLRTYMFVYYKFPNKRSCLYNRGGIIKEEDLPEGYKLSHPKLCYFVNHNLNINVDGDVILCCQDFKGEVILDNVMNRDIIEIWLDKEYIELREKISKGESPFDICKRCRGLE